MADDNDFEPLSDRAAARRPLWRRKRLWVPLALIASLGLLFLALRTPDTDRAAMIAKYGGAPSAFVKGPGGQSIHYRDQGCRSCPPMVLLHGANSSLHTWEPLIERLGARWRIVTLDLPGHGLTGAIPSGDYSARGMIAAVDVVAAHLELDRFILGGNSMGGWVAWRYALARPERVDALLLISASGMPPRAGDKPLQLNMGYRILNYPAGRWLAQRITPRSLIEKSLRGSIERQDIVTDAMVDRYWELLRFPGNREALTQRTLVDREPEAADRIGEIAAPTLVLFGKEDSLINASAATTFNERIKGSEVVLMDAIGHLPMEEAPDATAKAIEDFLTRRLPARR